MNVDRCTPTSRPQVISDMDLEIVSRRVPYTTSIRYFFASDHGPMLLMIFL